MNSCPYPVHSWSKTIDIIDSEHSEEICIDFTKIYFFVNLLSHLFNKSTHT